MATGTLADRPLASRKEIGNLYSGESDQSKIFMWRRGLPKKAHPDNPKANPIHKSKASNQLFSPLYVYHK